MKIKLETIIFWLLILGIIIVVLWLLHGSPTDTSAIVTIAAFTAASEILIWKSIFKIDNKASLGFEKIKANLEKINTRFEEADNKLNEIINIIKK